jgi:hypothetical protein
VRWARRKLRGIRHVTHNPERTTADLDDRPPDDRIVFADRHLDSWAFLRAYVGAFD